MKFETQQEARRLFNSLNNPEPMKLPDTITCPKCGESQPDTGRKHCFWCMAEFKDDNQCKKTI